MNPPYGGGVQIPLAPLVNGNRLLPFCQANVFDFWERHLNAKQLRMTEFNGLEIEILSCDCDGDRHTPS